MSGLNKATLIGNLGKNPEVRTTASGQRVVTFSLATSETWKDRATGERKERTEWHNVVIFNENLAKIAEQYLKKGSKVYLEGQLQTRKYTDKNGQERQATEVVLQRYRGELTLLDGRGQGGGMGDSDEGGSIGYGGRSQGGGYGDRGGSSGGGYSGGGASSGGGRGPAPAGGGRLAGDLDDDIPF